MSTSRDYAFEALAEVTSTDWNTGRGELNAALKSIKEQEPDILDSYLLSYEIHEHAKAYRQMFGDDIVLTPSALAKHWKRVVEQKPRPAYPTPPAPSELPPGAGGHAPEPQLARCATCGGDKMVWVTDEAVAPCPDCNSSTNADFWRHDGSRFRVPSPEVVRMRMRQ